jgi:hypothetical protein
MNLLSVFKRLQDGERVSDIARTRKLTRQAVYCYLICHGVNYPAILRSRRKVRARSAQRPAEPQ